MRKEKVRESSVPVSSRLEMRLMDSMAAEQPYTALWSGARRRLRTRPNAVDYAESGKGGSGLGDDKVCLCLACMRGGWSGWTTTCRSGESA